VPLSQQLPEWNSSTHPKKRSASNPGVQTVLAPAASDDKSAAIKPWM
jgi:hypothetical protein